MEYKSAPTEFKAAGDKGEYEGHFAVFNNQDDGGDVSHPGMFLKTLQERGKRVKIFYAHDWDKLLGPAPNVLNEDSVGLFAAGRLTLDSFWAGEVAWPLMKDGALTEGSFGYETIKADYADDHVRHLREVKLYEISPVPLGMNPLTQLQAIKSYLSGRNTSQFLDDEWRRLLAPLTKGAIAPHTSPKADEDTAWDGAAAVGAAEGARQLRMMHAWVDEDGDPDTKSSYKLPHHLPDGKVVLRGCQAAAGALMGARTPIAIPEADMAGVKRHITNHYHQFDRTAPWEEEAGVEAYLETLEVITHELKVGRVLSAANVEKARSALAALEAALEALNALLTAAEPAPDLVGGDKGHSALLLRQRVRAAGVALSLVRTH